MNILTGVQSELFKMFVSDARLTAAILAVVAVTAALIRGTSLSPLVGGAVLLVGCIGVPVAAVRREARHRAGPAGHEAGDGGEGDALRQHDRRIGQARHRVGAQAVPVDQGQPVGPQVDRGTRPGQVFNCWADARSVPVRIGGRGRMQAACAVEPRPSCREPHPGAAIGGSVACEVFAELNRASEPAAAACEVACGGVRRHRIVGHVNNHHARCTGARRLSCPPEIGQ